MTFSANNMIIAVFYFFPSYCCYILDPQSEGPMKYPKSVCLFAQIFREKAGHRNFLIICMKVVSFNLKSGSARYFEKKISPGIFGQKRSKMGRKYAWNEVFQVLTFRTFLILCIKPQFHKGLNWLKVNFWEISWAKVFQSKWLQNWLQMNFIKFYEK